MPEQQQIEERELDFGDSRSADEDDLQDLDGKKQHLYEMDVEHVLQIGISVKDSKGGTRARELECPQWLIDSIKELQETHKKLSFNRCFSLVLKHAASILAHKTADLRRALCSCRADLRQRGPEYSFLESQMRNYCHNASGMRRKGLQLLRWTCDALNDLHEQLEVENQSLLIAAAAFSLRTSRDLPPNLVEQAAIEARRFNMFLNMKLKFATSLAGVEQKTLEELG